MSQNMFLVAPSEAMLIGLCLQEYLLLRRFNTTLSFFQLMHSRINPFMPELLHVRSVGIAESELPDDVEWLPIKDMQIGRSGSEPNVFYGIDEQGAYRKRIHQRKHFLHLLTLYLVPHLGMEQWLRSVTEQFGKDDADITQLAAEIIVHGEDGSPAELGIRGEDDKPAGIEEAISSLVAFNEVQRFLIIGKSFGALIAAMQLYEKDCQPPFTMTTLATALHELTTFPEVDRSAVARNALASIAAVFESELMAFEPMWRLIARSIDTGEQTTGSPSDLAKGLNEEERAAVARIFRQDEKQARRETVLSLVKRVWPAVWVAFGEILGMICDLDREARDQDVASAKPRTFHSERSESVDKIRNRLKDWEDELSGTTGVGGTPENIVIGLAKDVEGLTKRLWEEEYDRKYKGSQGGLPSLLKDKMTSQVAHEQRFAQIAFALYKTYRNTALHDAEFECGFCEARYFVAGIRVLLELYEGIIKLRTRTSGNAKLVEGTIKKLGNQGFGFIETGKGQGLYFHESSLRGIRFGDLRVGQRVSYTEGRNAKGPCAENVTPR